MKAPTGLRYTHGIALYPVGTPIKEPNKAELGSMLTKPSERCVFTVSPSLPKGLTIDANDGTIGGNPVHALPYAAYQVSI
jgi:hypothetical protein